MESEYFFAISVDLATPDQLNSIHELVKLHAPQWWHQHTNFWIVKNNPEHEKTLETGYWRDLVSAPLTGSIASVIVLRLPPQGKKSWATQAIDFKWFKEIYAPGT